jgi:septal ring factor EnvC (AmiA/AmiB activator)
VQEGASVNIGQPIAKMGRNYNTTGLLNFEIRVNNKTSNPLFYLK